MQEILPRFIEFRTWRAKKFLLTIVKLDDPSLVMAVGERSGVRPPLVLDGASRVCQFSVPALKLRMAALGEQGGVRTDASYQDVEAGQCDPGVALPS